jgi:hypothetical protein
MAVRAARILTDRVLNIPVTEICLQGAGVVALVGHRMPFADSETARGESKPKAGITPASTSERTGESAAALYPKSLARNHKKLDRQFR